MKARRVRWFLASAFMLATYPIVPLAWLATRAASAVGQWVIRVNCHVAAWAVRAR